jgi:hypothetical protein
MKISRSFFLQQKISFWMVLYLLFFCVLSLGQLERIEWGSFPAFYVHDILLVGFVGWHALNSEWYSWCWKVVRRVPTVGMLGLFWVWVGWMTSLISGNFSLYAFFVFIRLSLYILSFFSVAFDLKTQKIQSSTLALGVLVFTTLLLYFGVLQYLFIPDTRILFFLGWDDHYYRLLSTLLDPGFTGLIFSLGYFFIFGLLSSKKTFLKSFNPRILFGLCIGLVIGILLTYSRASYMAFISGVVLLIFYFWKKKQYHFLIFNTVMFFAFFLVVPLLPRPAGEGVRLERTSTITSRVTTVQQNIQLLKTPTEIFFGRGLFVPTVDSSPTVYSNQPTHARLPDNWILLILTGTGLIGSVIFISLLFTTFRALISKPLLLWVGLSIVLIHSLFNASLTYPFVVLFLGSWGVLTLESSH